MSRVVFTVTLDTNPPIHLGGTLVPGITEEQVLRKLNAMPRGPFIEYNTEFLEGSIGFDCSKVISYSFTNMAAIQQPRKGEIKTDDVFK